MAMELQIILDNFGVNTLTSQYKIQTHSMNPMLRPIFISYL
jgi:hypothetical protein